MFDGQSIVASPEPHSARTSRGDELAGLRGVLLALSPGPALLLLGLAPEALEWTDWLRVGPALGGSALMVLGALLLRIWPSWGRALAGLGLLTGAAAAIPLVIDRPALGFGLLLIAGLALTRTLPARPQQVWAPAPRDEARGAAVAALVLCGAALPSSLVNNQIALLVALCSPALSALLGLRWALTPGANQVERRWRLFISVGLSVLVLCLSWPKPEPTVLGALLVPLGVLWATRKALSDADQRTTLAASVLAHPARTMVVTFAALGVGGGLALSLPICSPQAGGVHLLDALFTAVSASCVTGLTVVDTAKDFTVVGQALILVLIQVGGLGIMTFSTAALALFGMRMSLRHERTVAGLVGTGAPGALIRDLKQVLAVTFGIEGLGAFLLTCFFFADGDSLGMALWRGVFTSISAFCNAGFGLQSDNLVPYADHPGVLHVVGFLIIFGGLGPPVVVALPRLLRSGRGSLQAQLVMLTTLVLLIVPAALIAIVEWQGALLGMSVWDKLHNAWFQSVTLRTAGFNTVDMTILQPATVVVMILCMFIGGSPGSTAGGIKTTTAALLVLAVVAVARGRTEATAFGRRLPHDNIYRAVAITTVGALVGVMAFFALMGTQRLDFEQALFEVISAMGTVGLTIGGTPLLDEVGKVLIALCMYIGRIGPLTLFLLLTEVRTAPAPGLPEEGVPIG